VGLADTIEKIRSGVFNLVYLDQNGSRIGSGTGFVSCGFLITNHHVFELPPSCVSVWIRRDTDRFPDDGLVLTAADFKKRLIAGSVENQYDFAVLRAPEVVNLSGVHGFQLSTPQGYRVGQGVAFLGYPFDRENVTCHAGVISSFYTDPPANVIQLDASVNPSNSGGPLFDPETGVAFGIITRRATGLTRSFASLQQSVERTVQLLRAAGGGIFMNGIPLLPTLTASQQYLLTTLKELERQANVGIGFAFSIEHLMNDNTIHHVLHP
jgi:S1-C subfamily serine protease